MKTLTITRHSSLEDVLNGLSRLHSWQLRNITEEEAKILVLKLKEKK